MRKAASDNAYSSAGRTGNVLTVTSYRTNRSFQEKRVWLFACPPRFPKTAYVRRRFPTESYSGNESEFLRRVLPEQLATRYFTEELKRCEALKHASDPAEYERTHYFNAI